MANGKIRFGKQSGGQLALVIPDGVSNTEVIVPESGELVNKDYADLKVALSDFTGANVNLANNGYQKLPSGLIIQWGVAQSTTQGELGTNTFPVSFPNSCLSVILTDFALIQNLSVIWGVSLLNKNYFNYYWSIGASGIGSSPIRTPFYIAIGC